MKVEPSPGLGPVGQRPAHLLDDLPADEQAQPGPVRLGREVRLEEPAAVGQRIPRPSSSTVRSTRPPSARA